MAELRRLKRLLQLVLYLLLGMGLAAFYNKIRRVDYLSSPAFRRTEHWWFKRLATICGAEVSVYGTPSSTPVLSVANHISWLDIVVLGGLITPRFVSKQEVATWPVIGWLATIAGTLYITRGASAAQAAQAMQLALEQGDAVVVFPEGTTTDGHTVQPFFARLFAPALDSQTPVQPIALRYLDKHGQVHPVVPYIGEQSLGENLWALLAQERFRVEVHFLPIQSTLEQNRKSLAQATKLAIEAALNA